MKEIWGFCGVFWHGYQVAIKSRSLLWPYVEHTAYVMSKENSWGPLAKIKLFSVSTILDNIHQRLKGVVTQVSELVMLIF